MKQKIQTLHYDSEGNLVGSTDAAGNAITWDNGTTGAAQYPGLRNQTQYPTYRETYGYDLRNRRTRIQKHLPAQTDPDAPARTLSTRTRYDLAGNPEEQWDEANRTRTKSYDALNRLVQSAGTAGQTTQYAYDRRHNLIQVTSARGIHIRRYAYDKNNHKTETRSYRPNGQFQTRTIPEGQTLTLSYDAKNQLTRIELPGGGQYYLEQLPMEPPQTDHPARRHRPLCVNLSLSQIPRGNPGAEMNQ